MQFEPPTPVFEEEQLEVQPYRRLAGILVGETVSAILIMENGEPHIVKPGYRIPNSEWTVVSIDQDKAILRRGGSKKPNEITVRLESPPAGTGGGRPGGQQGGGNTGGISPGTGTGGGPPRIID
jgi:hypothetical protein